MSGALRSGGSTRRWRRLRLVVLERDGWRCQTPGQVEAAPGSWAAVHAPASWPRSDRGRALVCSTYADHADHVVPRSRGGHDGLDNLRAACARHNLERGAKLDTEPHRPTPTAAPRRWEWE